MEGAGNEWSFVDLLTGITGNLIAMKWLMRAHVIGDISGENFTKVRVWLAMQTLFLDVKETVEEMWRPFWLLELLLRLKLWIWKAVEWFWVGDFSFQIKYWRTSWREKLAWFDWKEKSDRRIWNTNCAGKILRNIETFRNKKSPVNIL